MNKKDKIENLILIMKEKGYIFKEMPNGSIIFEKRKRRKKINWNRILLLIIVIIYFFIYIFPLFFLKIKI